MQTKIYCICCSIKQNCGCLFIAHITYTCSFSNYGILKRRFGAKFKHDLVLQTTP